MIPPLLARIQSEKGRLQQHFGSEYDAYRARTSRMIPWIY
jgi:protein-S-isoprenylcysteine O-methyltransferase Ste14